MNELWGKIVTIQYTLFGTIAGLEVAALTIFATLGGSHALALEERILFTITVVLLFIEVLGLLWMVNSERRAAAGDQPGDFQKNERYYRFLLHIVVLLTWAYGLTLLIMRVWSAPAFFPVSTEPRQTFLMFPNHETFWVALGAVATSIALIYELILKEEFVRRQKIQNIKHALKLELRTNVRNLFCGEVERPSLFDVILKLRSSFVQDVCDQDTLFELQELYIGLSYYQRFVEKVYLNPGIANYGPATTEKQLQTCNLFLKYFGEKIIEYNPEERGLWNEEHYGSEYYDYKRDQAVTIKDKNQDIWYSKINSDVERLFR